MIKNLIPLVILMGIMLVGAPSWGQETDNYTIYLAFNHAGESEASQSFLCEAKTCAFPLRFKNQRIIMTSVNDDGDIFLNFKNNKGENFSIGGGSRVNYRIEKNSESKNHVIDLYAPLPKGEGRASNDLVLNPIMRSSGHRVASLTILVKP